MALPLCLEARTLCLKALTAGSNCCGGPHNWFWSPPSWFWDPSWLQTPPSWLKNTPSRPGSGHAIKHSTSHPAMQKAEVEQLMVDVRWSHVSHHVHQFFGRVISRRSEILWTQHSSNLNILNYFFWTYTRMQVQQGKLATIIELKKPSRTLHAQFWKKMVWGLMANIPKQCQTCKAASGGHF